MDIIQIVSLGLVATLLILLLKEYKSSVAFLLLLFTVIILFLTILDQVKHIFQLLSYMADKAQVEPMYFKTILKIIGIAYIAEFGAQLIRDAGLNSLASKVELAGKLFILMLAIPIVTAVIETILNFIPGA
ncbi:stage III sporulation protein AD [Halobacillus karajensis]|uniref:Stage III sporulation protein AD n=1 Tax=Halobacillus karajensis TaxID=195088 RepID=A0A024P5I9_9BACI|nr:stage III sporulation protein AD [Halobacillus karajensis]CDQ17903.1 stage III sporulation protein AD [Halobacillus karajensis]CDQ24309.1 stage III sporulation protein AD [Halobacillus karajensis]CDQ29442.1 stage III sporulation protein AD [Halobacillus karajensis]SEH61966.1 stage III sporulation protein AD [Halobacillus karajensis]